MSASVHWSAILYSIWTDNLEVPIIYRVNMLTSMFAHPPPASESVEVEQTDAVS